MYWIDVNDRLPKIEGINRTSDDCLVCGYSEMAGDVVVSIGWINHFGDWELIMEDEGNDVEVSYWAVMPDPPND